MSPYARRVYVTILLMVTGFAFLSRLTQIAPPSTRFVFLGAEVRLGLPSHPASRRRSCLRLGVSTTSSSRGLPPPIDRPCRAYSSAPPAAARRWLAWYTDSRARSDRSLLLRAAWRPCSRGPVRRAHGSYKPPASADALPCHGLDAINQDDRYRPSSFVIDAMVAWSRPLRDELQPRIDRARAMTSGFAGYR
jgi:hypothetical protein